MKPACPLHRQPDPAPTMDGLPLVDYERHLSAATTPLPGKYKRREPENAVVPQRSVLPLDLAVPTLIPPPYTNGGGRSAA